jgi:MFS family permease
VDRVFDFFGSHPDDFQPMNEERTTLRERLGTLPRPVWILFLGTFLNKFGTFVMPFLALYMTRQGFTTGQAGIAIGVYGIGNFMASGLGGYLADRIGRRNTIVLSMFSGAVAMMLLSQARSFDAIVLVAGLVGLTNEMYRPASSALLADLVPAGQRVTAYAAYRLAFNAGWAFGPATAGFIAGHSYLWLFAGDAFSSLLFGIVAWFALPHGFRGKKSDDNGWSVALKTLSGDRKFLRVLAASFAIAFVFLQMGSTFGLHVTHNGHPESTYGAILSLNGVLVVCFELYLTTITQRFPARRVMAFGYLLIGGGFAFNAFAHSVPALAFGMIIFTVGEMCSMPVSSAYIADLAPPHLRGRYMGVMGFTWASALIFGPGIGMTLFAHNPIILWTSCGALGVLAALIIASGKE